MNYKEIMLGESGTKFKAVSLATNRVVNFSTSDTHDAAIQAGTHREYDAVKDAHLEDEPSNAAAASGGDSGAQKQPARTKRASAKQSASKAAQEPSEPSEMDAAMDAAYDALPPEDRAMIYTVSKRTATFWTKKLKVLAGTFAAGNEAQEIKRIDKNGRVSIRRIPADPQVAHKKKFMSLMDTFATSSKLSAQVDAVTQMVKAGYIALDADENSTKIYLETGKVGMEQEFFARSKTKASKEMMAMMHAIAKTQEKQLGVTLPRYDKAHFGKKADKSGQHNEYGVAFYIQQGIERTTKKPGRKEQLLKKAYGLIRKEFKDLSGNDFRQDLQNQEAAEAIKEAVAKLGKLTKIDVVGKTARRNDPLNPTDIVVTYIRNGVEETANFSLKTLVAPKSITLRTLGQSSWKTMFGDSAGSIMQRYYQRMAATNNAPDTGQDNAPDMDTDATDDSPDFDGDDWRGDDTSPSAGSNKDDGTPAPDEELPVDEPEEEEERSDGWEGPDITELDEFEKEQIDESDPIIKEKIQFTKFLAKQLAAIGQDNLRKMWDYMHGCNNNVSMVVTHNLSGKSSLVEPDKYCGPGELKIVYHGRRISVRLDQVEGKSSYLEFNYRARQSKVTGERTGQFQVLRKFGGQKKEKKDAYKSPDGTMRRSPNPNK